MSLQRQVVSGTGWAIAGNSGKYVVYFVVLVVLARLLSPREFGLVAMATVFSGFANQLNELGFGAALVQRQAIEERHRSSVFWLSLLIGLGLAALLTALAPAIAHFYDQPQLILITSVISLNFIIGAGNTVQTALLQRELAFRHISLIDIGSNLFGGVVAISLAVLGAGVWSIVSQNLATITLRVIAMWYSTTWRPKFIFDRDALRDLMGFSLNLVGIKSLNYWISSADNLLIGRFTNTVALGLYTRAYSVMLQPVKQITWVLGRVMFPAFSRIQDDKPRIKSVTLSAHRLIALITMPMMIGLIIVADDFVQALFGPQWAEMIPILRTLSFVALIQPLTETIDWIYRSQGRTDIYFKWGLFAGFITIAGFIVGLNWGVQGVATAYAISTYLLWYPAITLAGRLIDLTFREFITNILDIIFASFLMASMVWIAGELLPSNLPPLPSLILKVGVGIISYGAIILLLKPKAYYDLRGILARRQPKFS